MHIFATVGGGVYRRMETTWECWLPPENPAREAQVPLALGCACLQGPFHTLKPCAPPPAAAPQRQVLGPCSPVPPHSVYAMPQPWGRLENELVSHTCLP